MSAIWSGIRTGARSLRRTPSFTWSVVLLLGLGIGAVTTIFSIVDHVLLRDLPYPDADRLVVVEEGAHSGPTYRRLETMQSVDAWAGVFTWDAILTGTDEPMRLNLGYVTRDYFAMFGARPAVGRLFVADDFGAAAPVVLSYGLWQRVWGADPGLVGRTIRLDGEPRLVVGVMDAGFDPPEALAGNIDVFTPVDWGHEWFESDNTTILSVAGRLAPTATLGQARAEAEALAARRAEEVPGQFALDDGSARPLPLTPIREATVQDVRAGLGLIFGAVALLLLVACVNVAHLFMARGVERIREMAVRRALGAGSPALARQLGTESALVGLAGSAIGVGIAVAGIGAFRATAAASLPRMDAIAVDVRVLAFAIALGMLTALAFGLLPALRLATGERGGSPLGSRSNTADRRTHAVRHGLVVVEVALSLILVAQAGWLIRSFVDLHTIDLGFRTTDVWTLPVTPTGIESPEEWNRRLQGVRESLATVPGVTEATFGLTAPLQFVGGNSCCWRSSPTFDTDQPGAEDDRRAMIHPVDPGFFDVFEPRVVAGRAWSRDEERTVADGSAMVPAVISEPLAVRVFGSAADALGHRLDLGGREFNIMGVAADNRYYGPDRVQGDAVYVPAATVPFALPLATFAVRTERADQALVRSLAEAVWAVEPDLPVPTIRPMEEWARVATARARFLSGLFTAFGAVALLLVAGGLAGTLLYAVRLRRRELGVRLALGATPRRLEGSVLRRGALLTGAGVVLGGIGAWMSAQLIEGLMAGVNARDPGTFGVTVAVLLTVALAASWWPARRAAQTDPIDALRVE